MFAKGRKASLVISTLEALAVLAALILQCGEAPRPRQTKVLIAPTLTDHHQSDDYAVHRVGSAHGAPREDNRVADPLANGQFEEFDESLRIPVASENIVWDTLPAELEAGSTVEAEYQQAKTTSNLANRARKAKRRRSVVTLLTKWRINRIYRHSPLSFPLRALASHPVVFPYISRAPSLFLSFVCVAVAVDDLNWVVVAAGAFESVVHAVFRAVFNYCVLGCGF